MGLKQVECWTDGSSCGSQEGPGGWAALLCFGTVEKEISGYEIENTTNQRMEMTALLKALLALRFPCEVTVMTDSAYLMNAFVENWLDKWGRNGWRNSQKEPVANRDLWEELLEAAKDHTLRFVKVKGHTGIPENERVDQLAVAAKERAKTMAVIAA